MIAYAADDQQTFDKFLRFILYTARIYGCAGVNKQGCSIKSTYLMPWLVDQTGQPFHYTIGGGYLTNGSATDADITIAWALTLAAKAVEQGDWQKSEFDQMDYMSIAKHMSEEIARYDINKDVDFFGKKIGTVYGPGSQWGDAGKNVLYPGYFAPQAFDALSTIK